MCSSQTTIFSPSAFGMFQSKVCITLYKKAQLWRNGLITSQGDTICNLVACLVAMVDPVCSIDFVCRGGKGTRGNMHIPARHRQRDMLDRYSPGTE